MRLASQPGVGAVGSKPVTVRATNTGQPTGSSMTTGYPCPSGAGVSRSTAAVALVLAQALPERPSAGILDEILRVRPQAWPNLRLLEIGDAVRGRGGGLIATAAEVYRRQLEARPQLADDMVRGGRGREVALARTAGPGVPDPA